MIIRSLALRHGRFAIARSSTPKHIRQWRRPFHPSIAHRLEREEDRVELPTYSVQQGAASDDAISFAWQFKESVKAVTTGVGADIEPHYKHGDYVENPLRPEEITLEILMAAQCHLGHHTSLWHPANARYIHGTWGEEKEAIHIISLDATAAYLRRACKVIRAVAEKGGLILIVGTRKGQILPVVNAAKLAGGYHLFDHYRPGSFSNGERMLRHGKKKVVNHQDEEQPGFGHQLDDWPPLKPDLVVCLNSRENYALFHECGRHNIPTIGILDTDVNPTWMTYPIPANDDSLRSVSLIAGVLGKAAEQGQQTRRRRAEQGYVDFVPSAGLKMPHREDVAAWHQAQRGGYATGEPVADEMEEWYVKAEEDVAAEASAQDIMTEGNVAVEDSATDLKS